jgi:signal transduction histidine kinase
MTEILETLMAAARAEAGLDRGRSEVNAILGRMAAQLSPQLGERGVELRSRAAEPEVVAGVDPEVIERILAPLLDNAGRYARARITLTGSHHNGGVAITVSDDGPGVADPESIFEPGVSRPPAGGHSGAGLGLPLARRLARAAGGDVRLAATPAGGGAEFRVLLP